MDPVRLLVVDPDPVLRTALRAEARSAGLVLDEAVDGISAIKMFRRNDYPLVLLNMDLPELDGRNVFLQLRSVSDVPIFILCDHPTDANCQAAYQLGADDYLRKPIVSAELVAHIQAFLRRNGSAQTTTAERKVSYRGLYIDTFSHTVYVDEQPIQLTPKKYALLAFLSQNPNRAYPREILLDEVWGPDFIGSERTVDTHIKSLRSSIRPYDHYLVTVWGYGYKFEA